MRTFIFLLLAILAFIGCSRDTSSHDARSVAFQEPGVTQVAEVTTLANEKSPLGFLLEQNQREMPAPQKEVLRGVIDRRSTKWEKFRLSQQPGDQVFRVSGSDPQGGALGDPFEYYIVVHGMKESGRFWIIGGDGLRIFR